MSARQCRKVEVLARDIKHGRSGWALTEEVTSRGGEVLVADYRKSVKDLRLKPGLKGWHRITVGLHNPNPFITGLRLRLSRSRLADFMQCSGAEECAEELDFGVMDLTGQSVILSQPENWPVRLDYIRFTPAKRETRKNSAWRVGAINDFYSFSYSQLLREKSDLQRCVWQHSEAGFNVMYWIAHGGSCMYRSRVGTTLVPDTRERTKYFVEFIRKHDVLRLACDECRKAGMTFYPWFRINNEYGWATKDMGKDAVSRFWREHPKFREIERSGKNSLTHLSFAFPEVRAHKIALAKEMLSFGADGILIDTQRHPPMVQYSRPAVESFRKKYGKSPLDLPEHDERWLRHKAEFFTEFMRALRVETAATDPKLKVSIRAALHPGKCLKEGVDVETLLREKLIDELIPSAHVYFVPFSLKPFRPLLKGSDCLLIGGMSPYHPTGWSDPGIEGAPVWPTRKPPYAHAEAFLAQNDQFRRDGAKGVAVYESEAVVTRPEIRKALRHIAGFRPVTSA